MKGRILSENIQEEIEALTLKINQILSAESNLTVIMTVLMGHLHFCLGIFPEEDRARARQFVIDIMNQDFKECG